MPKVALFFLYSKDFANALKDQGLRSEMERYLGEMEKYLDKRNKEIVDLKESLRNDMKRFQFECASARKYSLFHFR